MYDEEIENAQKIITRMVELSRPSLLITCVVSLGLLGPIGNFVLMSYEGTKINALIVILATLCFLIFILVWIMYFWQLKNYRENQQINFKKYLEDYESSTKEEE